MVRSMMSAICAATMLCATIVFAQPTPPVMPKILELPLPPAVELPPPPTRPSDVPNRPLTADEAVALALHHQPAIAAAQAGVAGAQGRVQQNEALLKPSVNVGAQYGVVTSNTSGPVGTGTGANATGFAVTTTVRQLVYDFNHTRDLVRAAMAQERSAQAALTRTQADLALQVKLAFYTYLQNVRLVTTSEANVRNRLGHFALAQARLKTGLGLPSDVVTAQTAYAQAVYNLAVARNNSMAARINLAEILGIDPRTPIEPANVSEPAMPATADLNALTEEALRQRPEMVAATAGIEAARFGISAARTTNKPTVFGSAGVGAAGTDPISPNHALGIAVGLQWTPVDSGFTAGLVKQAEASLQTAQAVLDATRLGVIADVAQAYLNVRSAEQRAAAGDAEVANAEEGLRLAQGRYRAGVAIFIEVLDAETALDTANINSVNARSAQDQALASLAHATGAAPKAQ
jgi:outer membrane protein